MNRRDFLKKAPLAAAAAVVLPHAVAADDRIPIRRVDPIDIMPTWTAELDRLKGVKRLDTNNPARLQATKALAEWWSKELNRHFYETMM